MPTPKTPKTEPSRVEPEEARASGGALAEANPPQEQLEYVLVTVDRNGTVRAHSYESIYEVAEKIMEDIEEAITPELLDQLPITEGLWEAVDIQEDTMSKVYTVIKRWDRWEAIYKVPIHKATLYVTHDEVLGTMGPKLYIKARALVTRNMAFYRVQISRGQIKDLAAELMVLLGGSP